MKGVLYKLSRSFKMSSLTHVQNNYKVQLNKLCGRGNVPEKSGCKIDMEILLFIIFYFSACPTFC